ncbi:MAG: J domain-containing protein [Rhodobacteraceae bacterium]|nr:J domain-containing protein [Paracoccaceae bacterium]
MRKRSPLNFDISVGADKKRRAKKRGMSGAVETSSRKCNKDGCKLSGKYRAPKSADQLDEFIWFCLDHVREHNRSWNFFDGQTHTTPDQQAESDKTWGLPTEPFAKGEQGANAETAAWKRFGFDDPMEVLGANATMNPAHNQAKANNARRLPPTERKALDILGAPNTLSKAELRKVYKALVKDLHPDLNGGRRDDEEKLTEVVWAWEQVKISRVFTD